VNTESELGITANDIKGEVKEDVFGKWVWRTYSWGPVCTTPSRWSAQLVASQPFTNALSRVCWKKAPSKVDAWF